MHRRQKIEGGWRRSAIISVGLKAMGRDWEWQMVGLVYNTLKQPKQEYYRVIYRWRGEYIIVDQINKKVYWGVKGVYNWLRWGGWIIWLKKIHKLGVYKVKKTLNFENH